MPRIKKKTKVHKILIDEKSPIEPDQIAPKAALLRSIRSELSEIMALVQVPVRDGLVIAHRRNTFETKGEFELTWTNNAAKMVRVMCMHVHHTIRKGD